MRSKKFKVTYDKKIGGVGEMIVKASDERNALHNAERCCFTGTNFRDPVVVEDGLTFTQMHPNGKCDSNKAN